MQRFCVSMGVLYQLMAIPMLGHWLGVLAAKGLGWSLSDIAGYSMVPTVAVVLVAMLLPSLVKGNQAVQENLAKGPRAALGKPGLGIALGVASVAGGFVLVNQGESLSGAWGIGLGLGMLAALGLAMAGIRMIESRGPGPA